jgi:hypothetical protein
MMFNMLELVCLVFLSFIRTVDFRLHIELLFMVFFTFLTLLLRFLLSFRFDNFFRYFAIGVYFRLKIDFIFPLVVLTFVSVRSYLGLSLAFSY